MITIEGRKLSIAPVEGVHAGSRKPGNRLADPDFQAHARRRPAQTTATSDNTVLSSAQLVGMLEQNE